MREDKHIGQKLAVMLDGKVVTYFQGGEVYYYQSQLESRLKSQLIMHISEESVGIREEKEPQILVLVYKL